MIENKEIKKLVSEGIVESLDYYQDIEFNIFPLLDFLRTEQIEQLYKWLNNTYNDMNMTETNNVGIEYLIAVKSYLSDITTRTGTAYTQ